MEPIDVLSRLSGKICMFGSFRGLREILIQWAYQNIFLKLFCPNNQQNYVVNLGSILYL